MFVRFAANVASDITTYELPSTALKPSAVVVSPLSSHNHNQSSNSHNEEIPKTSQLIGAIVENSSTDTSRVEEENDIEVRCEKSPSQSYAWDQQRFRKTIDPLVFINHSDQSVFTMVQHSIRKSYEDQNPSVIIQNNQSRYSLANTAESMSPIQYTQLVAGDVSPSTTMIVSAGPITPPSTSPVHFSTLQSAIAGNVHFGGSNQLQQNHHNTININNNNNHQHINNNNIAFVDWNYQLSLDLSHKTAGTDKTGIDDDDANSEAGVDEKSINHQIRSAHHQHQHHDNDNDHIERAKMNATANHIHYTNIDSHLHTDSTATVSHMHLVETHHDNNGIAHHHLDLLTNDQHHHISPESAALRNGLLPMYSPAVYSSASAVAETGSSSHSPIPISSTSNDDTNGLMQYNYGHTSVLVATGTTTGSISTNHTIDDVINDTLKDEPDHCSLTGGEDQSHYVTLTSVQDLHHLKDQHYVTDQQHQTANSNSSGGDSRGSPSGLSQSDFDQGLQNFTHLNNVVVGRKLYGGEHGLAGQTSGYDISTR